jgi:hypothetical protein
LNQCNIDSDDHDGIQQIKKFLGMIYSFKISLFVLSLLSNQKFKRREDVTALTVTCLLSSFDVHLLMFIVFPCFRFIFLDALFCVCLVIHLSLITSVFSCEIYFYVKVLLFFCFYFFLTATFIHHRSTLRSLFSVLINCQLLSLFFIQ